MLMTILGLLVFLSLLQGIWPCTGNCSEPQWCMTLLSDNGDLITPMLQAPPEENKLPDKEQEVTLELRPVTEEAMVLEQLQHIVCPYSEDLFGDSPMEQYPAELVSEQVPEPVACCLDKIEFLQSHENQDIYQKAFDLIEHYFGSEDEDSSIAPQVDLSQQQYIFQQCEAPMEGFQL
ncbi:unnamed protein product [Eretmochelys imbricata]